MNVDTRYDAETGVIFCTVSGPVDPVAHLAIFTDVFDDPEIPNNADAIWDVRDVDFSTASPDLIKRLADSRVSVDAQRAGSRFAVVLSSNDQEALVRLYMAHVAHIEQQYGIFRSMQEAVDWMAGPRGADLQPPASNGA